MVELPTELWLRIISFIPDVHLYRMASVNQLFLDQATDRRYRKLIIDDDRPTVLLGKLAKHQDSAVAVRVRSLTIYPKAVRSACLRSAKSSKSHIRPAKNPHWLNRFRLLKNVKSSYRSTKYPIEEDVELADIFLTVLAGLNHIEEYSIEWDQGVEDEIPFCFPLLNAMWTMIGHNLRVIRLDMMLRHMASMVSALTGLDRVQEVVLNLTCNDARLGPPGSSEFEPNAALEQLAAFLNSLALSLNSLTISSSGHLDFSRLYNNLTYFPRLINLSIFSPCDPRHVVDPTGLRRFLYGHRGVERLNFSPKNCCYRHKHDPELTHESISPEDWLSCVFENVTFSNLRTLELGLSVGLSGKRVMLPVPRIGHAAKNVKSLTIAGCIIALEDLRLLLDPFSLAAGGTSPRTLVLEVHVLDVALLDLLADLLPGMETLDLTYRWINRFDCTNATELTEQLKGRRYDKWRLSQLLLCCSRKGDNSLGPSKQAFAPSLSNLHYYEFIHL